MIICIGLYLIYLLFFSDFNEICIFPNRFLKNTQISNFMKIYPVAANLFHADWHDAYRSSVNMLIMNTVIVIVKSVYHFTCGKCWYFTCTAAYCVSETQMLSNLLYDCFLNISR
jgi:hypothetical protein